MDNKIFGLYDLSEVKIEDPGLKRVINLDARIVLRTQGKIKGKFSKTKVNVVERLANVLAVPGHRGKKHKIMTSHASGKFNQKMKTILKCLESLEKRTGQNPIQVLVKAIENAAPRDEITTIEYGGAKYPQAVDVSPLRRLNLVLKHIVHGAYDKSFNKKAKIEDTLADEIFAAFNGTNDSLAMQKKNESEKQADSSR